MRIELGNDEIREAIKLYCELKGYNYDHFELKHIKPTFGGSVLKCELFGVDILQGKYLLSEDEIYNLLNEVED